MTIWYYCQDFHLGKYRDAPHRTTSPSFTRVTYLCKPQHTSVFFSARERVPSKMNLINLLLHRNRSRTANEPEKTRRNLQNLPPEILQMIMEYLTPVDTACLTLCNHALLWVIGNRHWSASLSPGKDNEEYRESFLTTLTRDLPGHFFCHHCSRLHRRDDYSPPGPLWQPEKRSSCPTSEIGDNLFSCLKAHPIISRYRFAFPHLQLAMKRFHHGPGHGVSTESLLFTEVQVSDDDDEEEKMTTMLSVEARICPKPASLCLRIQHWALINSTKRHMILSKTNFVKICDHISIESSEISQLIESQLQPPRTVSESQGHPDVLKCRHCNTDFEVAIKELGEQGLALVITKWLDLGSGLTPEDTRWRFHLPRLTDPEIGKAGQAGDIRLRFESELGLSQDSLSSQNASYLIDKRYMSVMDRLKYDTWVLQGGKRLPFFHRLHRTSFIFVLLELLLILFAWQIVFMTYIVR